jgi:hypothetical protein
MAFPIPGGLARYRRLFGMSCHGHESEQAKERQEVFHGTSCGRQVRRYFRVSRCGQAVQVLALQIANAAGNDKSECDGLWTATAQFPATSSHRVGKRSRLENRVSTPIFAGPPALAFRVFNPLQKRGNRVKNQADVETGQRMTETRTSTERADGVHVSIGIIAWNEERNIGRTLESLFQQSLFQRLSSRNLRCEILCLANGCTDRTREIATRIFEAQSQAHSFRRAFVCRVLDIRERGKNNTWNQFVHSHSAPEAQLLILMDADILIDGPNTLANMAATLEEQVSACVATDRPCKKIVSKRKRSFMERLSLMASQMTQAGEAQLCGQLYCIRSEVARRIYLPKDLAACEDGFIKAIVCTDFLTTQLVPGRILLACEASHTFEAYTSIRAILKNQKRQMIGQAIVHILVDDYLKTLSLSERLDLARTLQEKDKTDPFWLKRLIGEHLRRTRFFWRLIPGIAGLRFKRLARLRGVRRVACVPAALAGFLVSMVSCFRARTFLMEGQTQYWPHAKSSGADS